jgi:hypothetical protein
MKIDNVLMLTLDEDERFTDETFDLLKDLYRILGVIENEITLFCGERTYHRLMNHTQDRVFRKNGILYTIKLAYTLGKWNMLIGTKHGDTHIITPHLILVV